MAQKLENINITTEDEYKAEVIRQLKDIATSTDITRGWVTFIGVLIIIALVVQFLGSFFG